VLTPEEIDVLVTVISQSDLESSQVALARFQREALSHLVVVLATRLVAARQASAIHDEAQVAAQQAAAERDKASGTE
jgi:hypothetical protein